MNGLKLLNCTLSLFVGLAAVSSTQIVAETAIQPAIGDCSREFLVAYFPASLVEASLQKANVPKEKWESITTALTANEKNIVTQVEEKASKISPNPLKDPQQRQVAVRIFRETLLQIFSDVLKKNGITDDKQIQSMLDEIQQEKAKRFADCLERHKQPSVKHEDSQGNFKKDSISDAVVPTSKQYTSPSKINPTDTTSHQNSKPLSKNDSNDNDDDYDDDDSDDNDDDDYDDDDSDDDEDVMHTNSTVNLNDKSKSMDHPADDKLKH